MKYTMTEYEEDNTGLIILIPEIGKCLHQFGADNQDLWDRDLANAQLIVTAVNSHAALREEVARLREAAEYAKTELRFIVHGEGKKGGRYEEALNKLEAALKGEG